MREQHKVTQGAKFVCISAIRDNTKSPLKKDQSLIGSTNIFLLNVYGALSLLNSSVHGRWIEYLEYICNNIWLLNILFLNCKEMGTWADAAQTKLKVYSEN